MRSISVTEPRHHRFENQSGWSLDPSRTRSQVLLSPSVPTTILASQEYAAECKRTQISERTIFWQADLDGMPLSDAAVRTAHHAIVDTGTSLLTGHTTDEQSIAVSLQWGDHHPVHSRSQRQPRRHVFRRWCRVREGCQLGWHLLLRVDRDRRSSTLWPFCGAWKRLGFALTGPVTDCQSIAASFNLLSSLAYAFDCSATCGFVCAVDGADCALTDRDLSAGGTCFVGMTAPCRLIDPTLVGSHQDEGTYDSQRQEKEGERRLEVP